MHLHYQSNYSNEVHQLIVCVSKHLYITKNGRIKYQQKSFDVSLSKVDKAEKEHLVHYLIRDHFSGVFYAEIHSGTALISVEQFLFRAWSQKEDYAFCGAPEFISVPKTVSERFPTINRLIEKYGFQTLEVTSGFQSGTIQDVKTWEDLVRGFSGLGGRAEILQEWTPVVCARQSAYLNDGRSNRDSKTEKWRGGANNLRVPPTEGW
jgi:hypothetical protein